MGFFTSVFLTSGSLAKCLKCQCALSSVLCAKCSHYVGNNMYLDAESP